MNNPININDFFFQGHENIADELARLEQRRKLALNPDSCLPFVSISSPSHSNTITLHSATSVATIDASDALESIDLPESLSSLHSMPSSPSLLLADTSTFNELNPMSSAEFNSQGGFSSPAHSSLSSSQSSLTSLSSHTTKDSSLHLPSLCTHKVDDINSNRPTHSLSVDYGTSETVSQGDVFLRPSPRR